MTKKELIKYIEENTGETESWGDLNSMKKIELEQIFEYLGKVNGVEDEIVEEIKEESIMTVDSVKMQEYVIHKKPSNLSIAEQRAYIRSGILPKIKVNKYDRFDSEDIKFGF